MQIVCKSPDIEPDVLRASEEKSRQKKEKEEKEKEEEKKRERERDCHEKSFSTSISFRATSYSRSYFSPSRRLILLWYWFRMDFTLAVKIQVTHLKKCSLKVGRHAGPQKVSVALATLNVRSLIRFALIRSRAYMSPCTLQERVCATV